MSKWACFLVAAEALALAAWILVSGCALKDAPEATEHRQDATELERRPERMPKPKEDAAQVADAMQGPTELPDAGMVEPEVDAAVEPVDAGPDPVVPSCVEPAPQALPIDCAFGFTCTQSGSAWWCTPADPGHASPVCANDWDCLGSADTCIAGACVEACAPPQCVPGDADRECCTPVAMGGLHPKGDFTQRCIDGVWDQCRAAFYTELP